MSASVPSASRIRMKVPQLDMTSAQGLQRILEEVAEEAVREAVQRARLETEQLIRRSLR